MNAEKLLDDLNSYVRHLWDSPPERWGNDHVGPLESLVGEIKFHQCLADTASKAKYYTQSNHYKLKERIIELLQIPDNEMTHSRLRKLQKLNAPTLIFLVLAYKPDELMTLLTPSQFSNLNDETGKYLDRCTEAKKWLASDKAAEVVDKIDEIDKKKHPSMDWTWKKSFCIC